jgi:hypothetical protein
MVVAVPPITDAANRALNVENVFHLNIWTPRQWHHVLGQFFSEVECYCHQPGSAAIAPDLSTPPELTTIDEQDFVFPSVSLDEMYGTASLTAVFVAQRPRLRDELPALDGAMSFVEDSYTRSPPLPGSVSSALSPWRNRWRRLRQAELGTLVQRAHQLYLRLTRRV